MEESQFFALWARRIGDGSEEDGVGIERRGLGVCVRNVLNDGNIVVVVVEATRNLLVLLLLSEEQQEEEEEVKRRSIIFCFDDVLFFPSFLF